MPPMTLPTVPNNPDTLPNRTARRLAWGWLALLILTLAWDMSGADMWVMRAIGTPEGFPLRHDWLMERVLHDALRLAAQLFFLALVAWSLWPARGRVQNVPRRERLIVIGLIAICLVVVNVVKYSSLTSCPWDLQAFGGDARYVSHWAWGVSDGGSGRCFPGGHASSAFAFLPMCLPWLLPPVGVSRRAAIGWRWLAFWLVVGVVAGTVQSLRGAHHPSHSMWTLLICAAVSLVGWRLAARWRSARSAQVSAEAA